MLEPVQTLKGLQPLEHAWSTMQVEPRQVLSTVKKVLLQRQESNISREVCSTNSIFMSSLPDFLALRLMNGNDCAGRVEVFYNGTWGSICSNSMSQLTTATMCKHLGCGDGGGIEADFKYGRGSGPTWLDHVECTEQHSSLWQCQSDPWNPQSCNNRAEETHITCTGNQKCISDW